MNSPYPQQVPLEQNPIRYTNNYEYTESPAKYYWDTVTNHYICDTPGIALVETGVCTPPFLINSDPVLPPGSLVQGRAYVQLKTYYDFIQYTESYNATPPNLCASASDYATNNGGYPELTGQPYQYIYPPAPQTRSGDDIYTFDAYKFNSQEVSQGGGMAYIVYNNAKSGLPDLPWVTSRTLGEFTAEQLSSFYDEQYHYYTHRAHYRWLHTIEIYFCWAVIAEIFSPVARVPSIIPIIVPLLGLLLITPTVATAISRGILSIGRTKKS
jgi:hypothetical protein